MSTIANNTNTAPYKKSIGGNSTARMASNNNSVI